MCTTTFQTATPNLQKLDPLKRVNYTFGLVLGVEEFLQTDTYFLAKHHLENRLLHGYGTACGLDVVAQSSPQLEVQVTPGWAINPKGQEIRVPQLMCVKVNDWLQANLVGLQELFPGGAPAELSLCVVLCYRECKTDVVPIPGEPCQTQASPMAPSRIADSFELMLCLNADGSPPITSPPGSPPQGSSGIREFSPSEADVERGAIRALVRLLSEIQVSANGPFLTLDELKQLVRGLVEPVGSPPVSSPPWGPPYYVSAADSSEFMRAAFRTWITEARPQLNVSQGVGPCCPPKEKCVLLSEATIALNSSWSATGITLDDARRPFLVPTALLQELAFDESAVALGGSMYAPVAAGLFNIDGSASGPTHNQLSASVTNATTGEFLLTFSGYQNPTTTPGVNYILKGTVQDANAVGLRATLEFLAFDAGGIRIRILDTNSKALGAGFGFMVEISQVGGAS